MLKRMVDSTQRGTRVEGFSVDGTATASIVIGSNRATLVDNSTGDYTLTFTDAFARVPLAFAQSLTDDVNISIAAKSATAINITCFDSTDGTTAKDADFDLLVWGFDIVDEH